MKNKILGIFTSLICLSSLASCADSGRQIVSIAVYNGDNSYVVGESFADTQLAVTYDKGEKELVYITFNMVEGFDTSVAGTKTLIISYGGLTTEFEITVSNLYKPCGSPAYCFYSHDCPYGRFFCSCLFIHKTDE